MKIVHLTTVHPAFDNRIFYKECLTISAAGHETVLIAPHREDEVVNTVQIRSLTRPKGRISRLLVTGPRLLRKAIGEQGDIYHLHDPEIIWVGIALRLLRRRVVFDMHENLPKLIRNKDWIWPAARRPLAWLARAYERMFLPFMEVVLAELSYEADYAWHRRSVTVLNLPNLNAISGISVKRSANFSVGYIGRIHEARGALVTLDALIDLGRKDIVVEADFVGDGDPGLLQTMDIRARENALTVRLHGYQNSTEGLSTISSSHVGLAILSPIPNYVDSYPTKIFEYMALGIPVITSNFPLYKSIVEKYKCGICVNPTDPGEVSAAIEWLHNNADHGARMGREGQLAAHRYYNWDAEGRKLLDFYCQAQVGVK